MFFRKRRARPWCLTDGHCPLSLHHSPFFFAFFSLRFSLSDFSAGFFAFSLLITDAPVLIDRSRATRGTPLPHGANLELRALTNHGPCDAAGTPPWFMAINENGIM